MEKYYLMAIEKGNTTAMEELSHYYYEKANDYITMAGYKNLAPFTMIKNDKKHNISKEVKIVFE